MKMITIRNADLIDQVIEELKSAGNKVLSNCYLDAEEMQHLAQSERLQGVYEESAYLNLLCQEDSFQRLYFYIAKPEQYKCDVSGGLIADVFYRKTLEQASVKTAIQALESAGFESGDTYTRWSCPVGADATRNVDSEIGFEIDSDWFSLLYRCFDKYQDYLPLQEDWERYVAGHSFIRYPIDGPPAGGAAWTKKGSIVTVEHIFTAPEQRGRGVGSFLYKQLLATAYAPDEKGKMIAWINDANQSSIALHSAFGYKKDVMKKMVMKKGL